MYRLPKYFAVVVALTAAVASVSTQTASMSEQYAPAALQAIYVRYAGLDGTWHGPFAITFDPRVRSSDTTARYWT
jgi:hypothetical protein